MITKSPVVTLLDIETGPVTGYTWATYEQNVLKVLEPSKLMSVAWKELGSKETNIKALCDYKGYKAHILDDEALVRDIWKVMDKSDVIIAHHGDAFDIKKLNARFVFYGLGAPSAYRTVDTKKVASRYFKFDGNSLNALGSYLNKGKKINNGGFELWVSCIAGDKNAWKLMKDYNVQDVVLLEQVYLTLRPFIANHPNLNLIVDSPNGPESCPSCLSPNVQKRGFSFTKTGKKQRFQCNECHSWSSGPFTKTKNVLS